METIQRPRCTCEPGCLDAARGLVFGLTWGLVAWTAIVLAAAALFI